MDERRWIVALLFLTGVSLSQQMGEVPPSLTKAIMDINDTKITADQGNWTVEDCILVRIASQITLKPDPENHNITVAMELPVGAVASGTCGTPETNKTDVTTQKISLNWNEVTPEGIILYRNITMEFSKNVSAQKYGVSRISAVYDVKQYIVNSTIPDPKDANKTIPVNVTVTEYVSMTTFKMQPPEFLVPINRSYLCTDAGSKPMHTELHKSNENSGDGGIKLPDAVLSAKKVQLDAFRGESAPPEMFQTSMDCTYRPNDVVPIIVGCALAGLVLCVLIAYLVGRRKSRARGYQSV